MNTGPRRAAHPTFHGSWQHFTGNQACCAHLLRDFQDCAETYPGAIWPGQAQRALRGLIHAWHEARDQQLSQIPADIAGPLPTTAKAIRSPSGIRAKPVVCRTIPQ